MTNAEYRAIQVGIAMIIAFQIEAEGWQVPLWMMIYMLVMDAYRWTVNKLEPTK